MDVCLLIKSRLDELGLEQKDLAAAAEVTESYVSQLLSRKKLPPAPDRTDIYEKMEGFLKLSAGKLAKLAHAQRTEHLRRGLEEPPAPLFREVRELVLRKCTADKRQQVREIFERHPFGELERFITQKLLDVIQRIARSELENEKWLRKVARVSGRSYKQMRVMILEFLDTDVFRVSAENCISFLNPLLESWNLDLSTFGMEIVLNQRLVPGHLKKLEFVERELDDAVKDEPGLTEFLQDVALSGNITRDEIAFLGRLTFKGRRPSPLYYYRELQNLRDPMHFRAAAPPRRNRVPTNWNV
jgi:transcriptional regulator with XRE-family HTH domain